jgi:hypothetical protein
MPNTDVSPKQGVVGSRNSVVTVLIPSKRHTITSNIWRRILADIVGLEAVESGIPTLFRNPDNLKWRIPGAPATVR